jgi:hypothetical protein
MRNQERGPRQLMLGLSVGLALLWVCGCYPPSALTLDYGNSVRNNIAQQVVNPRAGYEPTPAVGLTPQATANELDKYNKSFKSEEKKNLEMKLLNQ